MAQSDEGLGCSVFLLIAGAAVFLAFSHDKWSNALWYSVQYRVGFNDVQTDTKPSDCDFLRSPLGDKGCSYRARVQVFNTDGMMVAGEGAPMFSIDTKTGKPIISYDGGKTWDWYTGTSELKPHSVRVSWVKE